MPRRPYFAEKDGHVQNIQEGHEPVETAKKEEDRLYEGPKNDKVGYSVYQLETRLHKGRAAIKAALSAMKKEPAKWVRDNKQIVRYYLGIADMAELKKRLGVK